MNSNKNKNTNTKIKKTLSLLGPQQKFEISITSDVKFFCSPFHVHTCTQIRDEKVDRRGERVEGARPFAVANLEAKPTLSSLVPSIFCSHVCALRKKNVRIL